MWHMWLLVYTKDSRISSVNGFLIITVTCTSSIDDNSIQKQILLKLIKVLK